MLSLAIKIEKERRVSKLFFLSNSIRPLFTNRLKNYDLNSVY